MPKGVYDRSKAQPRPEPPVGRGGGRVYSDRPGCQWPNKRLAARALGVAPSTLALRMAHGRPVGGHLLSDEPPPWAEPAPPSPGESLEESRRLAAFRVSGCTLGPAVENARRALEAQQPEPIERKAGA